MEPKVVLPDKGRKVINKLGKVYFEMNTMYEKSEPEQRTRYVAEKFKQLIAYAEDNLPAFKEMMTSESISKPPQNSLMKSFA